ncbi:MAG TPA: class I SAM-dependent methyltransferase [Polyangiaceae bacterium]|nr:class I SAM-dependent methyltransferase [Polyangiaceae bacterium]
MTRGSRWARYTAEQPSSRAREIDCEILVRFRAWHGTVHAKGMDVAEQVWAAESDILPADSRVPMQDCLSPDELTETRAALLGPDSDLLIETMFRLALDRPLELAHEPAVAVATQQRWLAGATRAFTPVGRLVADSLREYQFWLDRGRKMHIEDGEPAFGAERYAGKAVLETGSGFGCNLFSFSRVGGRFVGLEPVAVYRQLTPILAEREGLTPPAVVDGQAESMPFADAEFDIVFCYSAHQYMDVRRAIAEMARVLKPGGQLQIIGGTLGVFAKDQWREPLTRRRVGLLKDYVLTIANTVAYERLGRRLHVPRSGFTSAPIYPRYRYMAKWMSERGLQVRHDLRRRVARVETTFIADKPT